MDECLLINVIEPGHEKTCLMSYANNKGADQPAHPRSLISAFVVRCLDSVMSLVSVTKSSSLMLASVAVQAGLSLIWSETPEDTFCRVVAHLFSPYRRHCWQAISGYQSKTKLGFGSSLTSNKTRAVRGSDYSPTIALSEEKDKLVIENWRDRKRKN